MVYIVEITRISAFRGYMTLIFFFFWRLYPVTTRRPAGGTLDSIAKQIEELFTILLLTTYEYQTRI